MKKEELNATLQELTHRAKSLTLKEKYQASIDEYERGLALLGDDWYSSDYSVILFVGIGEAYFLQQQWEQARQQFANALKSEGGLGDPYIHFRLGQIAVEQGNTAKAKDELMRAYMGSGEVIFQGEDPKYFAVIAPTVHHKR